MRRTVILASLAFPLLTAVVLALIVTRTESAPLDSQQVASPDPALSGTLGSAHAKPAAGTRSGSVSVAPSSTAPVRAEPARTVRSARAALLAAKLQHLPRTRQVPAPATTPARDSFPAEEAAAMEARGMDWRKLEQMMRNGVPGEPAAAAEEPAPRVQLGDEEE